MRRIQAQHNTKCLIKQFHLYLETNQVKYKARNPLIWIMIAYSGVIVTISNTYWTKQHMHLVFHDLRSVKNDFILPRDII